MKSKFFFTKEFCCCSLNSLNPSEIKLSYNNELKRYDIKRNRYYNIVSKTLGFQDWSDYTKAYNEKIIPFLELNGLIKYAPECNLNILEAENDLSFSHREIADRLFFDKRAHPKKIFTGYNCKTDNFAYYYPFGIDLENVNFNDSTIRIHLEEGLNQLVLQKQILKSQEYNQIIEKYGFEYLIPMDVGKFSAYHNLLSDLFVINENIEDTYLFCNYMSKEGLIDQTGYRNIAKLLKEHLLTIKKGWIEVIPFNENLIFLKAEDGTYDFVFKNLRDDKFQSPYSNHIKHENIPSILNEDYDFKRFLYFGFKEKFENLKEIVPINIWKERDEHFAEINFYKTNDSKDYPGSLNILKNFYIKEGLYHYSNKTSTKVVDGFNKITLRDKVLCVSELITIKDFFEFYNNEYKKKRSSSLDEIFTNNLDNETLPVSVTWYDAIAYCRHLEKKYNIPCRLVSPEEFQELCPSDNRSEEENYSQTDIKSELAFYLGNKQLSSPPPPMTDFDDVIMKYNRKLDLISNDNINFCTNIIFKEWSNYFNSGYAAALSAATPELEVNHHNRELYSHKANLNYKYKYLKIGFRVCYELSKDTK